MGLNHQQFVKDGRSRTKLYDKRDNFNFTIILRSPSCVG